MELKSCKRMTKRTTITFNFFFFRGIKLYRTQKPFSFSFIFLEGLKKIKGLYALLFIIHLCILQYFIFQYILRRTILFCIHVLPRCHCAHDCIQRQKWWYQLLQRALNARTRTSFEEPNDPDLQSIFLCYECISYI